MQIFRTDSRFSKYASLAIWVEGSGLYCMALKQRHDIARYPCQDKSPTYSNDQQPLPNIPLSITRRRYRTTPSKVKSLDCTKMQEPFRTCAVYGAGHEVPAYNDGSLAHGEAAPHSSRRSCQATVCRPHNHQRNRN